MLFLTRTPCDCRLTAVRPLASNGTLHRAYSAVFNGERAVVQLFYDNHVAAAALFAAWSAAGLAPPLLASERVHFVTAEHQNARVCVREVESATMCKW